MNHPVCGKPVRLYTRAVAVLSALLMAATACAAKPPITMAEMLNADSIGDVTLYNPVFSPTGRSFAFVRGIPIAAQSNWGYDNAYLVRSRVFVMTSGSTMPKEIPNTVNVHYSLAPDRAWSPDGRELLLLATTRKGYGLAIYDLASGKVVRLPGYVDNFFPTFDWAPHDHIVYYAVPRGVHQGGADGQVLQTLNKRWQAAWYGSAPQVTVSSNSPVFATSEPPQGALMLADPLRGTSKTLIVGDDYYAVTVAPSGRYIAAVRGAERLPTSLNFSSRRGELQIFGLTADDQAPLLHRYEKIDVSDNAASGSSLSWSPSGARLLVVGAPAADRQARLYVVDPDSGNLRQIANPALSFVDPGAADWGRILQVGWIGNHPIAVATHEAKSAERAPRNPGRAVARLDYGETRNLRFDVYASHAGHLEDLTAFAKTSVDQFLVPRGASYAMVIADGALWKVAPGEKPVELSPQGGPAIVGFGIDRRYPVPPPESAYYRSGEQERISLYAIGSKGKPERVVLDLKSHQLTPLKVRGEIVATAPDQLETLSKLDQGWTSTLVLNGSRERTVLTVNEALKDKAIAPVRPFTFTYRGKPLKGWVVLPPNAKPGTPVPAVESVYGGIVYGDEPPSEAKAGISLPIFSGQLLAAQGYLITHESQPVIQATRMLEAPDWKGVLRWPRIECSFKPA